MNYRKVKKEKLFFDKLTRFIWDNGLFFAFGLLLILQRGFGGFGYRACIDDWFLYLSPSTNGNIWTDYIIPNNKLAVRPFAGFADCYIITPLADHLGAVNSVLVMMTAAAAVMLYIYFKRNKIEAGALFLLAAAMCPLFMEAIYWISCASRVVPALFFTALAGTMLDVFFDKGKFRYFLIYTLAGMLAVGFYETMIPVYLIISLIPIMRNFKNPSAKFVFFIPIIHIVVIACYYFANSAYSADISGRGELASLSGLAEHMRSVWEELRRFLTDTAPAVIKSAAGEGFTAVFSNHPLYAAAIGGVSALFGLFAGASYGRTENAVWTIVSGVILTIAGIVVVFALENVRIPIRVVYACVLGAAIAVNGFISLFLWGKPGKIFYGVLCGLLAFFFTVAGIGEIEYYRIAGKEDVHIAASLLTNEELGDEIVKPESHLWLFGTPVYHANGSSVRYYEHIKASAENSAAFTGSLIYYTGNDAINPVVTVGDGTETNLYSANDTEKFYYAGLEEDYSISSLAMEPSGKDYILKRNDGSVYGTLTHMTKNIYRFDKNGDG